MKYQQLTEGQRYQNIGSAWG